MNDVEFERESKRLKRELYDEDINEIAEALASVGGMIPLAKKSVHVFASKCRGLLTR